MSCPFHLVNDFTKRKNHMTPRHTEVLVVGAGPVGLTLALDLTRRGIPCRIIDQAAAYPIGTRGRGISARTQEIFDDLGLIEQLTAYAEPVRLWRFYGRDNELVREIDPAASPAVVPTPDAPYRAPLMVSQQHTESVLRDGLASLGVEVEMNCQLIGLTQDATGVTASVTRAGEVTEILARYVIGCDGGHSAVRKLTGLAFLGETWDKEHHILANISVSGLDPAIWHFWRDPTKGGLTLNWMSHSETWFFIADVPPAEQGPRPPITLETLQRLFDERVGLPDVHFSHPLWISTWRPNIRMVDQYRKERVFLAGDAAHVHSAAGGQGLNTGLQDAYNLGWKLAAVLKGAPEALLDTYQFERLPIAQGVLATTSMRHREFAAKNAGQGIANLLAGQETFADATQLSLTYRGSRLSRDLAESPGLRAGDRAPDAPCLSRGHHGQSRLFDLFRGPHFTLLIFGEQPAFPLASIDKSSLHIYTIIRPGDDTDLSSDVLIDHEGHAFRAYGVSDHAFILVRPDVYIGLTGERFDQEAIIDYLYDVTGR
jgi:2-polyprenyl-6-methoxyphenol hydroxylase-like FAD-dependent oxidoreductase